VLGGGVIEVACACLLERCAASLLDGLSADSAPVVTDPEIQAALQSAHELPVGQRALCARVFRSVAAVRVVSTASLCGSFVVLTIGWLGTIADSEHADK
jgi:hypothetical protein